jgi:lysine 2,3-aminomutase
MTLDTFNREVCKSEGRIILDDVRNCTTLDEARAAIYASATGLQFERQARDLNRYSEHEIAIMRDCTRVIRSITAERSDNLAGFSVAQALWDIARDVPRNDLNPGFFAEMVHLFRGMRGLPASPDPDDSLVVGESGREAAVVRSRELDGIWAGLEKTMKKYHDGLSAEAVARREERKKSILGVLGGSEENWNDWRWQVKHIIRDCRALSSLVVLSQEEKDAVEKAVGARLPFGITPYYASLMDNDPKAERDTAIRTQVIPPARYVDRMAAHGENRAEAFDFMLEADTSPVDLITRRYPSIVILKPFNTCPQICVYCQRNWEIDQAMAPGAMARKEQLDRAIEWISERPAIREVLITGGDPLSMGNKALRSVLDRVAKIPHVEMIRVGSRVPVTLPMRITDELADMLGSYRVPGVRDVALVTHIEHVYEVTPELVRAVDPGVTPPTRSASPRP